MVHNNDVDEDDKTNHTIGRNDDNDEDVVKESEFKDDGDHGQLFQVKKNIMCILAVCMYHEPKTQQHNAQLRDDL